MCLDVREPPHARRISRRAKCQMAHLEDAVEQAHGQEVGGGLHAVLGGHVGQPLEQDGPHLVREVGLREGGGVGGGGIEQGRN